MTTSKNPHEDPFVRNPFKKPTNADIAGEQLHEGLQAQEDGRRLKLELSEDFEGVSKEDAYARRQRGLPEDTPEDLKEQAARDVEAANQLARDKYDAYYLRIEKRKFLIAYVLARAASQPGPLRGERTAEDAEDAWIAIGHLTRPPK